MVRAGWAKAQKAMGDQRSFLTQPGSGKGRVKEIFLEKRRPN